MLKFWDFFLMLFEREVASLVEVPLETSWVRFFASQGQDGGERRRKGLFKIIYFSL